MIDALLHRWDVRIILFCKFPEPGKVKTRLIPSMGAEAAAALQKEVLLNTADELRKAAETLNAKIEVQYTGATREQFEQLLGADLTFSAQGKGDLGVRMNRAFSGTFATGADKAILVGADIPDLTSDIMCDAAQALAVNNAVIGPAMDGGYYLLGLSKKCPNLFEEIEWGTNGVFIETVEKLIQLDMKFALLPALYDLDRPEDVIRWKTHIARR